MRNLRLKENISSALVFLSAVNPLIYMTMYLGSVPLFAYAYYCMPGSFYAPYAHLEPEWAHQSKIVASILEHSLQDAISKYDNPDGITVLQVNTDDGERVDLTIRIPLRNDNSEITGYRIRKMSVFNINGAKDQMSIENAHYIMFGSADRNFDIYDDSRIFPTEKVINEMSDKPLMPMWIHLSGSGINKINAYLSAFKGVGPDISGNIWRMLYLSCVVITTLGLGDIVPVTQSARAVLGVEAMSGVVLAGLFLNALAYRASRSKREE